METKIKFTKKNTNTGPLSINRHKVVTVKHPDGKPVEAGELVQGEVYEFNWETGVMKKTAKGKFPKHAKNLG